MEAVLGFRLLLWRSALFCRSFRLLALSLGLLATPGGSLLFFVFLGIGLTALGFFFFFLFLVQVGGGATLRSGLALLWSFLAWSL